MQTLPQNAGERRKEGVTTQGYVWSGILWPLGLAVSGCSTLNVPCGLVQCLIYLR